jgi:hypothetical protein
VREALTALLAAMLTAVTLFAFAGYQVTSEETATRLLGRLSASLVELDRWVPVHREDIELAARDRPQEAVLVDDLPVDVVIPSSVALEAGDAEMSAILRAAMGRRLHDEGHGAFQDEEGEPQLPVTEPVRWTISLLSSGTHTFWRVASLAAAVLTLMLLVSLSLSRRSPFTPVAVGAIAAAVASFFVWLVGGAGNSVFASSVDREIMLIMRDGAWLGLRNSLALAVIALSLLYLWRTLIDPRSRYEESYWPDIEQSDAYRSDPN